MSVAIDSVTIGGIEDRRIVLANAQIARVMDIGSTWTRLRIGMRVSFGDFGGNITGTPGFYVGVLASPSAGMANGPLTATTSHYVGYRNNATTWTRTGAVPPYYTGAASSTHWIKKINATVTTSAGTAITQLYPADPSLIRHIFMVEITKGANFNIASMNHSASPLDTSKTILETAMNISLFSAAATYLTNTLQPTFSAGGNGTVAVDEAVNGYLNAVCVAWDRINPTVHISDLMWARME